MRKHKKRRRQKSAARAERAKRFACEILSAIISGLITAAIVKWLGW